MAKIEMDELVDVIGEYVSKKGLDNTVKTDLIKAAEKRIQEIDAEKDVEKKTRSKKQKILIVSEEQLNLPVRDAALYMIQTTIDLEHDQIPGIIMNAAYDFNANDKRAKKHPIQTLPDAMKTIKKKHYLGRVTPEAAIPEHLAKEPVLVVAVPFNLGLTNIKTDDQ